MQSMVICNPIPKMSKCSRGKVRLRIPEICTVWASMGVRGVVRNKAKLLPGRALSQRGLIHD